MKPTYPPGIDAARERERLSRQRERIRENTENPAHFPIFGATQMTFKRITFEAAVAYARGKCEEHRDRRATCKLFLDDQGIKILMTCDQGKAEHTVSWHDLEQAHYDALRLGIDTTFATLDTLAQKEALDKRAADWRENNG